MKLSKIKVCLYDQLKLKEDTHYWHGLCFFSTNVRAIQHILQFVLVQTVADFEQSLEVKVKIFFQIEVSDMFVKAIRILELLFDWSHREIDFIDKIESHVVRVNLSRDGT